jgi:hypothetical protein
VCLDERLGDVLPAELPEVAVGDVRGRHGLRLRQSYRETQGTVRAWIGNEGHESLSRYTIRPRQSSERRHVLM